MEKEILTFIILTSVTLLVFISLFVLIRIKLGKDNQMGGIQIGGSEFIDYSLIEKQYREGIKGEKKVFTELKSLLLNDEYLSANVLLPIGESETTEIDCILISRKGIFCIEVKSWTGYINGCERDYYWYQARLDRKNIQERRCNPVKQNIRHCELLEEYLGYKYAVDNIVIFMNQKSLRGVISKHSFLLQDFKYCYDQLESDQLSIDEINEVCLKLSEHAKSEYEIFPLISTQSDNMRIIL